MISKKPIYSGRRQFLKATALGASVYLYPWTSSVKAAASKEEPAVTRIGLVADVHKDVMHDANQRMTVFVEKMLDWKPDFVLQMGDFCIPIAENQPFLDIWNRLPYPRHHVLGNHDMDGDGKALE